MPSTSNNLHEPNLDNDEADPEQEFVFPPYAAGEDTPHDPTGLDGWDSIPWTVEGKPHRRLQPLDYLLTQEIRTTHRKNLANTQNNKWNETMPQLFAAYLWLKEKTGNWTFTSSSFASFVHIFCKCQPTDRKSRQWIDCVDLVVHPANLQPVFPCA
ncbi:hypothetical protein PCASD_15241 [Puccinia coronata f. sp. avenae]|uniref:CxC1-like cysteine cluster associated with KDZ transposases domain-containing protein n=1 Tax=Puccinia coronata f. sp. avenae TaxID=200324 RepID=A0A2N5TCB8_9BASI|nr:hypothetical protein PCASD_15241 [Puccinia coronata f. sp. avenae]